MSTIFFIQKEKKYFQKSLRYKVNFPVNTKPFSSTKHIIINNSATTLDHIFDKDLSKSLFPKIM